MILIEDNFEEFFSEQFFELETYEYINNSSIERDELFYEKLMFEYLPKKCKILYNEALVCELFGEKNK